MKYLVCGLLNFESVLVGAGWEERLFALQSLKPPLRVSQQDSILKHNLFINNGSLKKIDPVSDSFLQFSVTSSNALPNKNKT